MFHRTYFLLNNKSSSLFIMLESSHTCISLSISLTGASIMGHNVKFSHICYRALGPELIPVYRQSVCRWLFKLFFGGRLLLLSARTVVTFPAEERHRPSTGTKLCCLVTVTHRCEQLSQGCYAALPRWESNPRSNDCKSLGWLSNFKNIMWNL